MGQRVGVDIGVEVCHIERMLSLSMGTHDCRGIVGDGRVGGRACWDWEGFSPSRRVGGYWLDASGARMVGRLAVERVFFKI